MLGHTPETRGLRGLSWEMFGTCMAISVAVPGDPCGFYCDTRIFIAGRDSRLPTDFSGHGK